MKIGFSMLPYFATEKLLIYHKMYGKIVESWRKMSFNFFCFGKIPTFYSPFCVTAKVIKLIGLTRPPFLSPTNLITFACTQNGE
jgi:hypothetical protein